MKKVTLWDGRKEEVMYIDDISFEKMERTNVRCVEDLLMEKCQINEANGISGCCPIGPKGHTGEKGIK